MTELEFYGSGKKVRLPSSWNEMSAEQIRFVFRTYEECRRKGASPLDFNVRVLYHLLGIRRRLPSWRLTETLCENVYRLCEQCLGFLFDDSGSRLALSFKGIDNPLPVIRVGWFCRLYGPGTLCQDLTFGEFRLASAALNRFFKTSDPSDLDECIRHLYRPAARQLNLAGRRVRPLGPDGSPSELKRVARIPSWQKNLVMCWFSACLEHLQKEKIILSGEEIEMSLLFSGDSEKVKATESFTWTDLLVQIARDGSVGNMDRVDREPLFSIIHIMWSNYKENKRYEKTTKAK